MPRKKTQTSKRGSTARRKAGPAKKPATEPADERMSLRRFLAASGLDSRRNCDEYIVAERITVDGDVVTEPSTLVDPATQRICVDGERAKLEPKRYFLLNKPKGFLCTNRDPRGRKRAVDLVTAPGLRLFTVGRLDENSEGLLLVTNDGDLANKLAHPRYQVRRKYRVQVAGIPKPETLNELKKGLHFREGRFRLHGARRLKTQGKSSFLEIEMREGQNREIRRLFARVGHKVMTLQRVEFGPLKLGRIASGRFRPLKPPEVRALREFVEEVSERKPPRRKSAKSAGTDGKRKTAAGKKARPEKEDKRGGKSTARSRGSREAAKGGAAKAKKKGRKA